MYKLRIVLITHTMGPSPVLQSSGTAWYFLFGDETELHALPHGRRLGRLWRNTWSWKWSWDNIQKILETLLIIFRKQTGLKMKQINTVQWPATNLLPARSSLASCGCGWYRYRPGYSHTAMRILASRRHSDFPNHFLRRACNNYFPWLDNSTLLPGPTPCYRSVSIVDGCGDKNARKT